MTSPITSRHAGNELLRPLLAEFAAGLTDSVAGLRRAAAAGDGMELARLSHRFKGEAATYGYPELAEAIERLEVEASGAPLVHTSQLAEIESLVTRIDQGLDQHPRPAAPPVKSLADVRALVVDDSEALRMLTQKFLMLAGLKKVDTADGGRSALDLCTESSYDLLLIDLQMPDLPGIEVVKALRARGDRTPAIAVSAEELQTERERCFQIGFQQFLSKPFSQAQLADAIRRCLRDAGR